MPPTPRTDSFALPRYFTTPDQHPYDTIQWETRTATIVDKEGKTVFEQRGIEVPALWSETASTIVASKYFRGQLGTPEREWSVKAMIDRVANTIADWGYDDNYFGGVHDCITFRDELVHVLVNQMASFNSPVWFNIGVPNVPQQASACFLLDVQDSMDSILNWYREEAMVFKGGSGSGLNVSKIRSKDEGLSGGGKASGVLSFMKAADASAGVIQSGGRVRRAAKMVTLDMDHPEIRDFIWCKALEERKARALVAMGYDAAIDGEAYRTVAFQNANHSVNASDDFLRKALAFEVWCTKNRTSYEGHEHKAEDLLHEIAQACHESGDPGMQFIDTINAWHTCPHSGSILSPNPCSEYYFLPYTACNLASINLLKFLKDDNSFAIDAFTHTVDVLITAMDILVGRADYPTPAITQNSHDYRTLGLGYANLGALLMAKGFPYDSDEGRDYAASITALMTGYAYKRSAELAAIKGPFAGFEANRHAMLGVIQQHRDALSSAQSNPLTTVTDLAWHTAERVGIDYGYRNAQVTLLAPSGTISFMMDCATTGVEPDVGLVNYKALVGGGTIKKVNPIVERALATLGYNGTTADILKMIETDGGPYSMIREEHVPVFDCAFPTTPGGRSIAWQGHIKMVAAVQPFLSGGVSKTINMPHDATVQDIQDAYIMAWKLGCKSIAIYRDGCKQTQVLTTQAPPIASPDSRLAVGTGSAVQSQAALGGTPFRKRLPDERPAITHKFTVGGQEGYFTCGMYADRQPAELFVHIAKEGSTLGGIMDAWATMVSLGLQYGVPLSAITNKLQHAKYEPMGFTANPDIRTATSITDYIAQWLQRKFEGEKKVAVWEEAVMPVMHPEPLLAVQHLDAPFCPECGSLLFRAGTCWCCRGCGQTSGCA